MAHKDMAQGKVCREWVLLIKGFIDVYQSYLFQVIISYAKCGNDNIMSASVLRELTVGNKGSNIHVYDKQLSYYRYCSPSEYQVLF